VNQAGTYITAIALFLVTGIAYAQPWTFTDAVDVTTAAGEGIFHHLESSGRRNVAVSGNTVAVVWEDNRTGDPSVYLARKSIQDTSFSHAIKISSKGDAFEPSLVALDDNRFAIAWEEDEKIFARLVTAEGPGPVLMVTEQPGYQASLVRHGQQLIGLYAQKERRYQRVRMQILAIAGKTLQKQQDCPVDATMPGDDQLYPTATSLGDRILAAWEDRRPGHTIIMAAQSAANKPCRFTSPQRISEAMPGRGSYGKGHGVARVALARYGPDKILAAWADKRDFREGYDIYAAFYQAGNKNLFGANVKVQDDFGGVAQQWHPTVSGDDSGRLIVAWDDKRDGNANIMMSWHSADGWSDDHTVPVASGQGEQQHPSVCLDREGNLHLVWLHRATTGGETRLYYTYGKLADKH
jgi:hypothetical protein